MIPKNNKLGTRSFIINNNILMKIRVWDKVKVMSWKRIDKNKEAKVLKVFKEDNKVLLEGVNIATRHIKKSGSTPWQIVKVEKSIDASNVMLVCPITNKPTKVGFVEIEEKGKIKKMRYSKIATKMNGKTPSECIIK